MSFEPKGRYTALIVVDVQNDFCEGGSLAVSGGNDVAERIGAYMKTRSGTSSPMPLVSSTVFTRDWHNPDEDNGGHFSTDPDYVDTWPYHCVRETEGAEFHPAIESSRKFANYVVSKGAGQAAYSAFEGEVDGTGMTLENTLSRSNVGHVYVCGLAADYCVLQTATDALRAGFSVTLIENWTAAVNPDFDTKAEYLRRGIGVITLPEEN